MTTSPLLVFPTFLFFSSYPHHLFCSSLNNTQEKKAQEKEQEEGGLDFEGGIWLPNFVPRMASMFATDCKLNFEETELRLGLPGGGGSADGETGKNSCKRGFSETVDLKLDLPKVPSKDNGAGANPMEKMRSIPKEKNLLPCANDPEKPSAPKAQVVGWPPVRSFRKNILSVQSYVKVSMDGAPYLRKVDLKMYKSYQDLSTALEKMFSSFTSGNCGSQGMNGRDFMNESKLMDLLNGSDYVPTYEDKDGDWMLVGDVPWEMFVDSCKRLRIMKGSEAIGLAPRAVEKCKNRS